MFVYDDDSGVVYDTNIAFDDVSPVSAVKFCYGAAFGTNAADPLPACEDIGAGIGRCSEGDVTICDFNAGTPEPVCCSCEGFDPGCLLVDGLSVAQGGCGPVEVIGGGSFFSLQGSSCICRNTNRGTRCWGSCQ